MTKPLSSSFTALETASETGPAMLQFLHSKSNTLGTLSNNAANDLLGRIIFSALGSGSAQDAASIVSDITGTPGASDSGGGRLRFQTSADGSITLTDRLIIAGDGKFTVENTVTAGGTTGDQTINKASGSVNFAIAAASLTVTNSLCTTSSIVLANVLTNDASMTSVRIVPGAGSFQIIADTPPAAETRVGFLIIN